MIGNAGKLSPFLHPQISIWQTDNNDFISLVPLVKTIYQNLTESDYFNFVLYSSKTPSRKLILPGGFVFSEEYASIT